MIKGKLILLFVFIAVFLASYMVGTFWGYNSIWDLWRVPTMSPHFADTRAITSGSEAYALGYDPLFNNVRDPWHRPMNLSRLWNILFSFKINQSHTTLIGSIFIASFFISPFIFIKTLDGFTACILSLLYISPAIMFGVERATPDLFLFFILAIGIRFGYSSTIAGLCFIIFAGFLKLFPVFGISLILKENKFRFWIIFLTTCSIFLAYFIFTFPDVKQMILVTPKGMDISYGANVFSMRLEQFMAKYDFLKLVRYLLPKIFGLLETVIILTCLINIIKKQEEILLNIEKYKYIDAFRVGACIYIGTFIFGNNWDYRLMFLIFTIPQIVCWIKQKNVHYFLGALLTLLAITLSFWYFIIRAILNPTVAYILDELCNWIVFSGLIYLFLASLPNWLIKDIYKISLLFKRKLRYFYGGAY